jgi:hypothetical protein
MSQEISKENNHSRKSKKYNNTECTNAMNFQECELAILRQAVDLNETMQGEKTANSEEVKMIIKILEKFLIRKKCICYGGTAINNILPKYDQFYNRDIEIPDYDFFSNRALEDAKELADIYYKEGYKEVEAKSGMHHGTFKVFVNFIPVADITYLDDEIFRQLQKDAIVRAGIRYAPPNYLRMSMYLELSRPQGDVSRWEKVFKRLTLLNKHYPLKTDVECNTIDFQRNMSVENNSEHLYFLTRDTLIDDGVVFFGGYGSSLYAKYMPENHRKLVRKIPDFDVLSDDAETSAVILKERLEDGGFKNVRTIHHEAIGEVIPERYEILVGKDTIAFIFKPIACHSYNKITIDGKEIKVATIDTILSFYLAFIYTNKPYFNKERILCMAQFLFEVEEKNRLHQTGLLKRFTMDCYGKQETLETIRAEKTEMFKKLSDKRGSREYEMWFLKYSPANYMKKSDIKPKKDNTIDTETNIKSILRSNKKRTYKKANRKTRKVRFYKIFQ